MKDKLAEIADRVRVESPLVHCITNYVTINDCANILLAYGASPAMCEVATEAYGFASISGAVYINLGTLTTEQEAACYQAVLGANKAGKPVVIDPAGCGAIPRKISVLDQIARIGRIDLIKGNQGEIMVLAGMAAKVKGVDSAEEGDAGDAAIQVAKRYGCTAAATGRVDAVSDGERLVRAKNGTEMLTRITGAVEAALEGGATMVQVREKDASTREFYQVALEVQAVTRKYHVPLVVNDRIDIALAIGAEGLHLGQGDMPIRVARRLVGGGMFIGISVSTVGEAAEAWKSGADYLGVGAVFPTGSKKDVERVVGLEGLREICAAGPLPTVAIGGVSLANTGEVMAAGTNGIAVISAILSQPDIRLAAKALRELV